MQRSLPVARLRDVWLSQDGLADEEVQARRARYGDNDILDVVEHPWWAVAADTARDPMLWFLAGVGLLYALVGQRTEALTLLAAILPLVAMDLVLHRRTRVSTAGLEGRLASRAVAVRNGRPVEISATDLVPGDLVLVTAGMSFPADGLVVVGDALQADESALTGEAYPVRKRPLDPADVIAATGDLVVDGVSWGFAGTRLLTNEATVRVAYTGADTLYGDIVRSATRVTRVRTPLQVAIDRLVRVLVAIAAVLCAVVAMVRLHQGFGWVDAVVSAVTLATAALPEEFLLVFTVFLGVGVLRLARRHALVRRAVSVENIGRVTCICSDKTGTITEGRLTVTGLTPDSSLSGAELLRLAACASRPGVGDPLDIAIAAAARAAGVAADGRILATFPFTESRKRETSVVSERDGRLLAVTKGAPEVVLALSAMSELDRRTWETRVAALADGGAKVLACAWRALEGDTTERTAIEPETGYRLAGILAFGDPVRDGVVAAVAACREAGVHTIMVTGDHPRSARAVARAIGLGGDTPTVVTGDELEAAAHRGHRALGVLDVVARATPAQKLRLVLALQQAGEVVAVTGDGVNDVPALQAADVGIAMGERATQSAREAASIVLLDDNFGTIVRAVGEGRQLFRNLRRSFKYLLMIHAPLVIAAALIPLGGYPLLFLPAHLVWLELIVHPTALLGFQAPARSERIGRRGAARDTRILSSTDWLVITAVGLALTALVVSAYLRGLGGGGGLEHGRAAALAVLTLASALISAGLGRLRTTPGIILSAGTIALSAILIQVPRIGAFLGLRPLDADDWAVAAVGALGVAAIPPLAEALRARGWIR